MYRRLVCLILAGLACAALGCSPKVVAGDASAGVDAVDGGVVDSLGDLAEDGGVADGPGDVVDVEEIGNAGTDAITDAIDASPEVDTADAGDAADAIKDTLPEIDGAGDATVIVDVIADVPDVPLPSDCTGDALLPPPDTTVLTDVGPLVPNKVVTGCGMGKPEPVAQGSECCDCPPPYSCYCNGECAWLRTPDMNIPAQDGKGVWTGKWVVAMTNYFVGFNEKLEAVHKVVIERWNPASTMGFLLSKHPEPDLISDQLRLFVVVGKVLVATETWGAPLNASGLGPDRPAYWYDPETDKYEAIKMPKCSGLVATSTHLACCDGGFGGEQGAVHLYDVGAKSWSKVKAPAGLLPAGQVLCWDQYETLIADVGSLYFINPVWPGSSAIWPDGTINKDGGHILRYNITSNAWKDLGAMPPYFVGSDVVLRLGDGILFGAGQQFAFFDLATGKTTISKSKHEFVSLGPVLELGCGVLMSTTVYIGKVLPVGQQNKYGMPAFMRSDLSVEFFPNFGFPSDDRGHVTVLKTDKHLLVLGGLNGNYPHKDGYRYPLSQICKGAKP